jgi:microtubule-associated protein tau
MNKVKVGMSQSPNIKQVRSKVGSLSNATHRAGGGDIRIEHRKLDWKAEGRTDALNSKYKPGGGDKKIENRKLEWNTSSKVGSLANSKHRAGGGNVKIVDQKINIKVQKGKVGSLDNVKHRPGGGDKKVFNDVEYMKQVSDHAVSITNASGPGSLTSSRRESSSQLMSRKSSSNSEATIVDTTSPKSLNYCSVTTVPNTKYQHLAKNVNGTLQSKVVPSPSYQFQMRRKLSPTSNGF